LHLYHILSNSIIFFEYTMSNTLPLPHRPKEFPIVDSENTLTDFSTIQKQLIQNANTNGSTESIICVEKTTTHHNYYDVEKLDDTANNSSIKSSAHQSSSNVRPLGMGNPAIIGKAAIGHDV
jgi:hypothetical protein